MRLAERTRYLVTCTAIRVIVSVTNMNRVRIRMRKPRTARSSFRLRVHAFF